MSSTGISQDESFYPSDGECVLDFVHIDSVDAGQSVERNGASGREGDGGCLQTCSWQLAASRITAHPATVTPERSSRGSIGDRQDVCPQWCAGHSRKNGCDGHSKI